MNKLDSLFSDVISSKTAAEEESAVEKVWQYMADQELYLEVYALDEAGNKTDVQEISDIEKIDEVEVVFSKGDTEKAFRWKPIENDNVFILYREK